MAAKRWFDRELLKTFWWTRGILAAITLVALVPNFVDLSRFEFLDAIHAAILSWNDFAAWVGYLIGTFFRLPPIPGRVVNFSAFTLSFTVPVLYGWYLSIKSDDKKTNGDNNYPTWFTVLVSAIGISLLYFLMQKIESLIYIFFIDWMIFAFFVYFVGLIIYVFYKGFTMIPGFARGTFTVITFLLALEVMYWGGVPYVTDGIKAFACERIEPKRDYCDELGDAELPRSKGRLKEP